MKTKALLILALGLLSCKTSPESVYTSSLDLPDEFYNRLEAYIRYEMEDKDIPGLAISITENDGGNWSAAYGSSDLERSTPLERNQIYRFASISKLFNASLIQQAVDRGELEWDKPIKEYVPELVFDNPWDTEVTLRHLVTHKSGLIRESPIGSYFDHTDPGLDATVESLIGKPVLYEPGSGPTKYSNAAVSVAGYVMSKVLGESFEDIAQKHLLEPLGMSSSSFEGSEIDGARLARGFMWGYDRPDFEAPVFEMGIQPAGNLYSSVEDLGLFSLMLMNEGMHDGQQVIAAESLREMWTPQFTENETGFGLGFFVAHHSGNLKVQHSGVMYGYASRLAILPERGLAVAVTNTADCANALSDRIASYAIDLALAHREGREFPEFVRTEKVPQEIASNAVGVYKHEDGGSYKIFQKSDQLFVDDGVSMYDLKWLDGMLIADSRLSYSPRFSLKGDELILDSSQKSYLRQEATKPQAAPPALLEYLGEYGWDHNHIFVKEQGGELRALIEWFFEYPMIPVSKDVYKFPQYGLYPGEELKFTRDSSGRINGLNAVYLDWPLRETRTEGTFKIEPVAPVSEILAASILKSPSEEIIKGSKLDLVDLESLTPQPRLDIRYASNNNFTGEKFYSSAKAFLVKPAAEALARAADSLEKEGFGLMIYDAYRPWYVTDAFFQATPEEMHNYVAKPHRGSLHNRAIAVDLGLYNMTSGEVVDMPSGYDEFRPTAFPDYPGGTESERWHRDLLREHMEAQGFTVERYEWWHYNFDEENVSTYGVRNDRFEEL